MLKQLQIIIIALLMTAPVIIWAVWDVFICDDSTRLELEPEDDI